MHPQPLFEFSLFGKDLSVYPYGIMTAIGIISAIVVFYIYTKKKNMPTKVQDFTFFVIIVAIATGMLFAKLYQAFYDLRRGHNRNGRFSRRSGGFRRGIFCCG